MSHVEDRWYNTEPGPDGKPVKAPTLRCNKGRRWRVRYVDPNGGEKSRSFVKKGDAENYQTEVDAELQRGTYRDPEAGRMTLQKYTETVWLPARTFDDVTREKVTGHLRLYVYPSFGAKRLVTLAQSPSTIEAWVAGLPLAPSTACKVFERLNAILGAAVRDGRIGANPCQGARLPRITRRKVVPWTAPQIMAVRRALPDRLAVFVDAGVNLGMRQSELFGLAVEDVEFLTGVVHVRHQVKLIGNRPRFAPPKSKSERDVPLSTRAREALAAHLAKYPAPRVTLPWHEPKTRRHGKPVTLSLIFPNAAGRALSRGNFNSLQWRPALIAAGLEDCPANGCHMMRHVFASTLIAAGVDVRTVAEYLGHSDGGALVLRTYSHLMPNAGDKTRRALDEALSLDTPDEDDDEGLASDATDV